MRILLVSPKTPDTFWSFVHALPFVSKRSTNPPLGLLTVAGLLPRSWELELVDLDTEDLSDESILWADYVFLGGMIVHGASAHEVAARCRELGTTIIAGGPLFSTGHEDFPEIEHFVLGECEDTMPAIVADLEAGCPARFYEAEGWPDLSRTPIPRWDLLDIRRYATMSVQFSRGCPHDCEFCDVIVMNGRTPRTKKPDQVVAELDALLERGWRGSVFIVDDNFIGHRRKAKELLRTIIEWRASRHPDMEFITEATVGLAQYAELLELMVQAGFKKVFLGLETPDLASLRECQKVQNLRLDLEESVHIIQRAGIEVMGGFIVGFDNDTADIFQRQLQFIQRTGVMTAMVGLLTALPHTRLYQRLEREGRLLRESGGNNTEATLNFIPRLDRELLLQGYRDLMQKLYEPKEYCARVRSFLSRYRRRGPQARMQRSDWAALFRSMWVLGFRQPGRHHYWGVLGYALFRNPRAFGVAVTLTIYGHHFRKVAESV